MFIRQSFQITEVKTQKKFIRILDQKSTWNDMQFQRVKAGIYLHKKLIKGKISNEIKLTKPISQ